MKKTTIIAIALSAIFTACKKDSAKDNVSQLSPSLTIGAQEGTTSTIDSIVINGQKPTIMTVTDYKPSSFPINSTTPVMWLHSDNGKDSSIVTVYFKNLSVGESVKFMDGTGNVTKQIISPGLILMLQFLAGQFSTDPNEIETGDTFELKGARMEFKGILETGHFFSSIQIAKEY